MEARNAGNRSLLFIFLPSTRRRRSGELALAAEVARMELKMRFGIGATSSPGSGGRPPPASTRRAPLAAAFLRRVFGGGPAEVGRRSARPLRIGTATNVEAGI
ncbi:hypothetical protein ACP70R_041544 [Stipagrostis hirtigluma subsp. patula]